MRIERDNFLFLSILIFIIVCVLMCAHAIKENDEDPVEINSQKTKLIENSSEIAIETNSLKNSDSSNPQTM